jgi:hypothetical protein
MKSGYATFKNYVYLGKVPNNVRLRAKRAGLKPVNVKDFRKIIMNASAFNIFLYEGTWYDTVKVHTCTSSSD